MAGVTAGEALVPVGPLEHLVAARSSELARELALDGAQFVVVGSTASRLRGAEIRPRDLDICVMRDAVGRLAAAVGEVTMTAEDPVVRSVGVTSLGTGWCRLDVFVVAELPASSPIDVDGVRLAVADV